MIQGEFDQRAHLVKTRPSGCAWIDVKTTPLGDALHKKDVAVTTHEQMRFLRSKLRQDAPGIARRTSPNVGHPNSETFYLEALMLRPRLTYLQPVNVSVNRPARGYLLQGIRDTQISHVAGMPHLV